MNPEQKIEEMLGRIAEALSNGTPDGLSAFWETPALVLSNDGAMAVGYPEEITAFFTQSIKWYRERGTVATRAEVQNIESLTMRLYEVSVRWPGLDANGNEVSTEHSRYLIRFDEQDDPRIRVAISTG